MANNNNLTAQQRAMLFGAATRQHFQMLGMQEVSGGAQTVQFRVPKARILQGVKLWVEAKLNVKHASGTAYALKSPVDPYKLFRLITIDFNNGFRPVAVAGDELAMNNMLYTMPEMVGYSADGKTNCKCPASLVASSAGTDNEISFMLDIPLALNYRDPVGLIMAQNAETSIDITLDIANANAILGAAAGYTCNFTSVKITPMIASFSIPSDTRAFPDFSVLKILDSRNESFTAGQNYVKLPTGMIYRKMILKFEAADGTAFTDEDITSNIDIVMNTADTPYSVSPKMLRAIDKMQSGIEFPDGCYYFSFDYQGVNGYGGSRDYIDAERITELAIRFNAGKAGKLTVISEKLSRLVQTNG